MLAGGRCLPKAAIFSRLLRGAIRLFSFSSVASVVAVASCFCDGSRPPSVRAYADRCSAYGSALWSCSSLFLLPVYISYLMDDPKKAARLAVGNPLRKTRGSDRVLDGSFI